MKILIECVPICQIDVPARQQNLGDLEGLMASLRAMILSEIEMEMTLPEPIIVTRNRSRFWLVRGWDPYYARRCLGLAETPAIVLEVEDLREELAKIDERLRHRELTTLECADQIIQRQQLLDALPPWARYGCGPGPSDGKKARKTISAPASSAGLKKKHGLRANPKAELITIPTCCRWCGGTQSILISQESTRLYCGCHSVCFQGHPW
jgi:hypothetical protein